METEKAIGNFPVSGEPIPTPVARWLGRIKAAAARANADLDLLDRDRAERIASAGDRIASGDDDQDDEDEEEVAPEPGADAADRVVPRRADEFVCESCFLVKHASQRVGDGNLCRDCV